MHGWAAWLTCCCACQDILGAALDLASAAHSSSMQGDDNADLGSCILQGMVQPVDGAAKHRQLTNERPFWQQRTFSMASSAIVQVGTSSTPVFAWTAEMAPVRRRVHRALPAVCINETISHLKDGTGAPAMKKQGSKWHWPIVQGLEDTDGQGSRQALLVCLAAILGALPAQLVRPQWPQLMPWMVAALQPTGRRRPELQPALLSSLQEALREPHGEHPTASDRVQSLLGRWGWYITLSRMLVR